MFAHMLGESDAELQKSHKQGRMEAILPPIRG